MSNSRPTGTPRPTVEISGRQIGQRQPVFVIAELSCNHNGRLDEALRIVRAAKEAGADAIKLQTYTPETISRSLRTDAFRIRGTIWDGSYTGDLYEKAMTPWSWHERLRREALELGLAWFSSPFDESSVDFLESLDPPAYKIASFEIVDLPLLRRVARTGKPVILSTGMTTLAEIDEAVTTLREAGCADLVLLHCNSGYPTPFEEVNLATIPILRELYDVPIGFSDHSLWADPGENARTTPMPHVAPAEAVRFGACLIEAHLLIDREEAKTLFNRGDGGFDWPFSRTPDEMKQMVQSIRAAESGTLKWHTDLEERCAAAAHGSVRAGPTPREMASRQVRPTLFVTRSVRKGAVLRFQGGGICPEGNVDSIRPGGGLHTRYAQVIDGARAVRDIPAGTPLRWHHVVDRDDGQEDPDGAG